MPGKMNARSDVSRADANARDTRKDAMTKPRLKEVVPYDKRPPEPRNRPSPDQHQERARAEYHRRLRIGPADAGGLVACSGRRARRHDRARRAGHAAFGRA